MGIMTTDAVQATTGLLIAAAGMHLFHMTDRPCRILSSRRRTLRFDKDRPKITDPHPRTEIKL